jgi:argininosuccinate lyase
VEFKPFIYSDKFEADISGVWNYENSVDQYSVYGGTGRSSVLQQIDKIQQFLEDKSL